MPTKKRGSTPRSAGASFVTHRKYLDAFALLAGYSEDLGYVASLENLAERVQRVTWPDKPKSSAGDEDAERNMRSAWGTELLLLATAEGLADDPAALRWMGNWAVVQAYYACNQAFLALASVCENMPKRLEHDATFNTYASMWADRRLDLAPWTLRVDASGPMSGKVRHVELVPVSAFTNVTDANAESKAAMAIRTTFEGAIEGKEAKARHKHGRLSSVERERLATKERHHTMLDYLYRLRRRMNYLDADMFAKGAGGAQRAGETIDRLCYLVSATCLVHEARMAAAAGPELVNGWMDGFLADCDRRNTTLCVRRQLSAQEAPKPAVA